MNMKKTKDDINVTNADIKSYNSTNGELVIFNARGDVSITAECPLISS